MGDNKFIVGVIVVAAIVLGYMYMQPAATTQPEGTQKPADTGKILCGIQPSIQLFEADKYDAAKPVSTTYRYKLNGNPVTTDSDGNFNAQIGDVIQVLHGDQNTTDYTPTVRTYTIDSCGENQLAYNDLLANNTITIQCFNEEGNPIDDSTENETIGTGEAPTLKCELRGTSKAGLPLGGVLTAELSGTVYKENEVVTSGLGSIPNKDKISGEPTTQALGAYSLAAAANRVRAFEVDAIEGAIVKTFYIYLPTEDSQDPSNANDITLNLYPITGYHEEDVSGGELRTGLVDIDNSFQRSAAGTETIQVD